MGYRKFLSIICITCHHYYAGLCRNVNDKNYHDPANLLSYAVGSAGGWKGEKGPFL
jgi:hypothetical protein